MANICLVLPVPTARARQQESFSCPEMISSIWAPSRYGNNTHGGWLPDVPDEVEVLTARADGENLFSPPVRDDIIHDF